MFFISINITCQGKMGGSNFSCEFCGFYSLWWLWNIHSFIHSLMNAVHFHFLQSFFLGLCFNAQEWAWGQCIPQPPVLVCLSVWCWLLWCQSVCQVLVTMVPVYLLGAGCCSDCLMLLLFRIWSKEISLYWKWAVDLEKWRPSIWWPLCRECHCDPTGNWYNSLRYYVENCLPCSVNTL